MGPPSTAVRKMCEKNEAPCEHVTKSYQQNHHLVSIPQAYKTKTSEWQISVIEKFEEDCAGE